MFSRDYITFLRLVVSIALETARRDTQEDNETIKYQKTIKEKKNKNNASVV